MRYPLTRLAHSPKVATEPALGFSKHLVPRLPTSMISCHLWITITRLSATSQAGSDLHFTYDINSFSWVSHIAYCEQYVNQTILDTHEENTGCRMDASLMKL